MIDKLIIELLSQKENNDMYDSKTLNINENLSISIETNIKDYEFAMIIWVIRQNGYIFVYDNNHFVKFKDKLRELLNANND